MQTPLNVFLSYARDDVAFCEELRRHLSPLEREGIIRSWHLKQIGPGQEWRAVVDERLDAADAILLLISADFISSDYCHSVDLQRALERSQRGEACVIPILVRPCAWMNQDFARLAMLPSGDRPVITWASRDEAWTDVVQGVRDALITRGRKKTFAPMGPVTQMKALSDSGMRREQASPTSSPSPTRASHPSFTAAPVSAPLSSMPGQYSASFVPPPPSRTRSSRPALWIGLVFVASLVIGALVIAGVSLANRTGNREGLAPQPLVSSPAAPSISTWSPSTPLTSAPPADEVCGAPCCGGSLCAPDAQNIPKVPSSCKQGSARCGACASGRACVPNSCSTSLEPARPWLLRVAGVQIDERKHPYSNVELCVRRAGSPDPYECIKYNDMAGAIGADPSVSMRKRLRITTSTLLRSGGLDIELRENGRVILQNPRAAHDGVRSSALCIGLSFPLYPATPGASAVSSGKAYFYLDDP